MALVTKESGAATERTEEAQAAAASTGSGGAATEHAEEPQLAELLNQEPGLSSGIELKVIRNEIIDYTYPYNGNQLLALAVQNSRPVLLGCCQTSEERQKRAQGNCGPLADWYHVEV
jgi:hypothetical protein